MMVVATTLAVGLGLLAVVVGQAELCAEVLNSNQDCDQIFSSEKCSYAYTPLSNPNISCQELENHWRVINVIRCKCQSNPQHQVMENMPLIYARRSLIMAEGYEDCQLTDPCYLPVLVWNEQPVPED